MTEFHPEIEQVAIDELIPYQNNTKQHPVEQIDKIAQQIDSVGFTQPILVDKNMVIIAGHGRLAASKRLGLKVVPIIVADHLSDDQVKALRIADNKVAESDYDEQALRFEIQSLDRVGFDLRLTGMDEDEIRKYTERDEDEHGEGSGDADEIPAAPLIVRSKLGDLYELGGHRVMCGDSKDATCWQLLMNGHHADICFTSPPYNVGRTPNGNEQKYLNESDDRDDSVYFDLLCSFTKNALNAAKFVFVNIQSLSGNKVALIDYLHHMRVNYADTIIWDKETAEPAMAKNCMNSQFEYIHVFSYKANRIIGTKEFRGTVSNIFKHGSRSGKEYAKIHKATFPVTFVEYFVDTFAVGSVIDPFGGTGTTLIACEKLKRPSYTIELDPHYIDVIVTRYVKFTGNNKIKLNGQEMEWT